MKTMLLNALKIAGLSAVFALPVINSNLLAEDTAVTQQATHKGNGKRAGHKKGGMKNHKNQGRQVQAADNKEDEAEEAAHLFKNTVKITAADNVSPENIMEHLNALKTVTGPTLRQGLYEIAMTSQGETYSTEAKEQFHALLVQAANEAEIGFDQMNEVLGVLRTNNALVTNQQVQAISRDLNDAPEKHDKAHNNKVPMRKGAKKAARPETHRTDATTPAENKESEVKSNKRDQHQAGNAAKKAAKLAAQQDAKKEKAAKKAAKHANKNEKQAARKQANVAKKADRQQAKVEKQAARTAKQQAKAARKAARNESKAEQHEAADVNEAAIVTADAEVTDSKE